jgi:signal transduction histidine kinase
MHLPHHIVGWLRVAGLSLGAYALFGGLTIPLTPEQTIFRLELQRAMEQMARLRALATDRQRIGRDLHDGTIQAIYGAGLILENGMAQLRSDPEGAESMFRSTIQLLNTTIQDVRRYIFELSDGEGQLAEAVGLLVSEMRRQGGPEIEYRIEGILPRYSDELRNHLLQITREAITNAIKHSAASEIIVTLRGEPDTLVLTVADNGRGLPPGGAFRPGGRGIPNLRARSALIGGTLRLLNRPGGGFVVEVVVPYREDEGRKTKDERRKTKDNGATTTVQRV